MRAALVQLTSGDDPEENLSATIGWLRQAALGGADLILTPEVTNCVSTSRETQRAVLQFEEDDKTLSAIRLEAKRLKKWILIGSLALKTTDADGRFANRSFMIDPNGEIRARYDKIHMFDVDVSETETYRESAGFRPGSQAIACETPLGIVGMTICYDLRFPALHRSLAEAGAQILTIPAAFSPVTGEAHWDVLLRARAIETGCFVLAPAQTGSHAQTSGKERKTYGHSMAISPWGEIIVDAGTDEGVTFVDIDINDVAKARQRIPSLKHARAYESPNV
jgi:predicted amidohydrolase